MNNIKNEVTEKKIEVFVNEMMDMIGKRTNDEVLTKFDVLDMIYKGLVAAGADTTEDKDFHITILDKIIREYKSAIADNVTEEKPFGTCSIASADGQIMRVDNLPLGIDDAQQVYSTKVTICEKRSTIFIRRYTPSRNYTKMTVAIESDNTHSLWFLNIKICCDISKIKLEYIREAFNDTRVLDKTEHDTIGFVARNKDTISASVYEYVRYCVQQ